MPTNISDAQASKLFGQALFVEASSANVFSNLLCDSAPMAVEESKVDGSKQTSKAAPCVRVTNLEKQAGNELTLDLFQQLHTEPVMGDDDIEGRLASLKKGEFSLKIDQYRQGVDSGGKMTQQKTPHDLRKVARSLLGPQGNKLRDQVMQVQLAGDRGTLERKDWMVPVATAASFSKIMVNPVRPPTFDHHTYANGKTVMDGLVAADTFSLTDVDRLMLQIEEDAFPLQPISYTGDERAMYDPLYVLYISPRQWFDFWTSASAENTSGRRWQDLITAAHNRTKGMDHPLFKGDCAMWSNILIKKAPRAIGWNAGDVATVSTNEATGLITADVTPSVPVHRAVLLGAQAVAEAWGDAGGKSPFKHISKLVDHDNRVEQSISSIRGCAKIRFQGGDGRVNDHGVISLDTAVSV